MKERGDLIERIQILIATGHSINSSKWHTCQSFQNNTRFTNTKGAYPIPKTSQSDQAIIHPRPWARLFE